ncbi:MAG: terminase small subunit [Gemmatimonadetes bacterium]|nr:terminase small subunit [Gemmatimonadota bacterium]
MVDLNATQAAIRSGYSPKTAYRTGADNLRKPQIAEAIAQAQAERSARTEITSDEVLTELRKTWIENKDKACPTRLRALSLALRHLGIDQPAPSSGGPDRMPLEWDGSPPEGSTGDDDAAV